MEMYKNLNMSHAMRKLVYAYYKGTDQPAYPLSSEAEQIGLSLTGHKPLKRSEPRHDKTNKMSVHPVKTQISLGICSVWSSLCYPHEESEESLGP